MCRCKMQMLTIKQAKYCQPQNWSGLPGCWFKVCNNFFFCMLPTSNLKYLCCSNPPHTGIHMCILHTHTHRHTRNLRKPWDRPQKLCLLSDSALIYCDRGLVSCYVHQRAGRAASFLYAGCPTAT